MPDPCFQLSAPLEFSGTFQFGVKGDPGEQGEVGKSRYQSYVETTTDDPVLTEEEWAAGGGGGGSATWDTLAGKPDTFPPSAHHHDGVYDLAGAAASAQSAAAADATSKANAAQSAAIAAAATDATTKADAAQSAAATDATTKANAAQAAAIAVAEADATAKANAAQSAAEVTAAADATAKDAVISAAYAAADSVLQAAIDLKAPLNSPALTGNPTAPTQISTDDSTKLATTAFVAKLIRDLVGLAPSELDTLAEIAASLAENESSDAALAATVAGKLAKASNLSDLTDALAARDNLGLSDTEIVAIYESLVAVVPQGEAETGAATTSRRWTALRVAQAAAAKIASVVNTAFVQGLGFRTAAATDTLLDGKASSVHSHDDRYYTETEVDGLLTGKAAASDLTEHETSPGHVVTYEVVLVGEGVTVAAASKAGYFETTFSGTITGISIGVDGIDKPSAAAIEVDLNRQDPSTGALTSILSSVASIATGTRTGTGTINGTQTCVAGERFYLDIDQGSDSSDLAAFITVTPT